VAVVRLEPQDAALAADLDLDLGLADAQDLDAVEAVAFEYEPVVDESHGTPVALGDRIEA
jgi:hypothetical protein